MEILLLGAVGAGFFWTYQNYKRLKTRGAALAARVKRIEDHLGLPPPVPPPEPAD